MGVTTSRIHSRRRNVRCSTCWELRRSTSGTRYSRPVTHCRSTRWPARFSPGSTAISDRSSDVLPLCRLPGHEERFRELALAADRALFLEHFAAQLGEDLRDLAQQVVAVGAVEGMDVRPVPAGRAV